MVYQKTEALANGNAVVQGASAIVGFGMNLVVDIGAIPFYIDLWNRIRKIYGRGDITAFAAKEYLKNNVGFLAQDLLWDKAIGSIPLIGIPFNIAFAKALTWRLGAWFGLISALGEDSEQDEIIIRATMELTREIFPSIGTVFSFRAPDRQVFISFIASMDGLNKEEAQKRTREALNAFRKRSD